MPKFELTPRKAQAIAVVAGSFSALRIIPIPTPVLISMGVLSGLVFLSLSGRALLRKRREKREDRKTAWTIFVRDRNVS